MLENGPTAATRLPGRDAAFCAEQRSLPFVNLHQTTYGFLHSSYQSSLLSLPPLLTDLYILVSVCGCLVFSQEVLIKESSGTDKKVGRGVGQ